MSIKINVILKLLRCCYIDIFASVSGKKLSGGYDVWVVREGSKEEKKM